MVMFGHLVKVRLLSLWNVTCHTAMRHKLLASGLTIFGVVLFIALYYGFSLFLSLIHAPGGTQEMVYEVFYFLFLFLLAGAVPFVASTLLHSSDYLLLCAAPVRPHVIVAAKLLDATVTNSLQFMVIGIPAIAACGTALHLAPVGWVALAYLLALFVLLPALATAFLLLVALAILGAKRVRSVITAVNVIMALIVCLTIVVQASQLQIHSGFHHLLGALSSDPSPAARLGPSGWFAGALVSFSRGDAGEGLTRLGWLSLLILALCAGCMVLGGRLLSAELLVEGGGGGGAAVAAGETQTHRNGVLALFSSPVAALIAKDLKYLLRDSVLLSQLGMPIILFFVPFVLATQESFRTIAGPQEIYPFSAAMTGVILFMQTSILSLSSIGLESRSFWLVMASPNAGRTLLWAKFIMSTQVSAGVGIFLTVVSALAFNAPLLVMVVQSALVAVCAAALCGMGVGISAALPRFVYENPAHRVSVWALILGFFATAAYVVVTLTLLAVIWFMAGYWNRLAMLIYLVGAGIFLLLSLIATLIPMAIGARRIEVYQWEY